MITSAAIDDGPPLQLKKSAAKAIIMSNLESGVLDENVPTARVAWDQVYSHMHEFADVTLSLSKIHKYWNPPEHKLSVLGHRDFS
jgi:hypothetical protein